MSRFQVTELQGFSNPRRWTTKNPGLSCMVVDTAYNYRVVSTFRSEDREYSLGRPRRHWTGEMRATGTARAIGRERCRQLADQRCAALNAAARS